MDRAAPDVPGVEVAGGEFQEREEVAHVQQVLVDGGKAVQQVANRALDLRDAQHEHAEVPDADLPVGGAAQDQRAGQTDQQGAQQARPEAPRRAALHQRDELAAETQVVLAPAAQQVLLEAEEAHLLDERVAGQEAAQVVLHA